MQLEGCAGVVGMLRRGMFDYFGIYNGSGYSQYHIPITGGLLFVLKLPSQ